MQAAAVDTNQIWKYMGEDRRLRAAESFYGDDSLRQFQQAADQFIARTKNFRLPFVKRLPLQKRAWYLAHLHIPADVMAQLIISYHFALQRAMMAVFLDALGIANNQGLIDESVEMTSPEPAKIDEAVQALRSRFQAEDVNIYLATLYAQNPEIWAGLAPHIPELTS
jgi:hypothetical protein